MTVQTVGSAGGIVYGPGDRLVIKIPPGALSVPTDISIQSISNTMPGGIGQAYRLGPDKTSFAVPIQITMNLTTADLNGTAPGYLRLVSQNAGGQWESVPGNQTIDSVANSVTVSSSHFSDWGVQAAYLLTPASAVVRPNEALSLYLAYCSVVPSGGSQSVSILEYCKTSTPSPSAGDFAGVYLTNWRLNQYALAGAPSDLGTLTPSGLSANYQAPAAVPSTNQVAASAQFTDGITPGEIRLVSNITISDPPGYRGAAEVRRIEKSVGVDVVTSSQAGATFLMNPASMRYEPSGFVSISKHGTIGDCTFNAKGSTAISPDGVSGMLFVPAGVPGAGKYSGTGAIPPLTLTGTVVCADGIEKPYTIAEPWLWWATVNANQVDSLLTPKPDGSLSQYSEYQFDKATLIVQSFKFVPTRK